MADADIIPATPPWPPHCSPSPPTSPFRGLSATRSNGAFGHCHKRQRITRAASEPYQGRSILTTTPSRSHLQTSELVTSHDTPSGVQSSRFAPLEAPPDPSTTSQVLSRTHRSTSVSETSAQAHRSSLPRRLDAEPRNSMQASRAPSPRPSHTAISASSDAYDLLPSSSANTASPISVDGDLDLRSPSPPRSPRIIAPASPAGSFGILLDDGPGSQRPPSPTLPQSRHASDQGSADQQSASGSTSLHTPSIASQNVSASPQAHSAVPDEIPPELLVEPPRRNLRTRKPGQLNPYTVEMAMYKQRLEKNDWEDAVVLDRHLRKILREEMERTAMAAGHPLPRVKSKDGPSRRLEDKDRSGHSETPERSTLSVASSSARAHDRDLSPASPSPGPSLAPSNILRRLERYVGKRRRAAAYSRAAPLPEESESSSAESLRPPVRRRRRLISSSSETDDSDVQEISITQRRSTSRGVSEAPTPAPDEHDALFKQLKRMMPVHMARKYIADLKNMRKGKAYHSDGHVSDTPEASSASSSEDDEQVRSAVSQSLDARSAGSTPATSPMLADLRPGETRKRISSRPGEGHDEGRFVLSGDSESDSDDTLPRTPSPESDSTTSVAAHPLSDVEEENHFDADHRWWTNVPSYRRGTGTRERDHVDRSLGRSKSTSSKRRGQRRMTTSNAASRPKGAASGPRQSRLHFNEETTSALKTSSRRHSRPAPSRSRGYQARGPRQPERYGENPPIVEPRVRRRLDLRDDDIIFAMGRDNDDQGRFGDEGALQSPPLRAPSPHAPAVSPARPQHVGDQEVDVQRKRPNALKSPAGDGINGPRQPLLRPENIRHRPTPVSLGATASNPVALHLTRASPRLSSSDVSDTQLEANAWADVCHVRTDFGIEYIPVGTHFASDTYIGRGRLHELCNLTDNRYIFGASSAHLRYHLTSIDFTLPRTLESCEVEDLLPSLLDAIFAGLEDASVSADALSDAIDCALRFLHASLNVWMEQVNLEPCRRTVRVINSQIDHLMHRLRAMAASSQTPLTAKATRTTLQLRWFQVELFWRLMTFHDVSAMAGDGGNHIEDQEAFHSSCLNLMIVLLLQGIHRSVQHIKQHTVSFGAAEDPAANEESISPPLHDLSTELWIHLIHLLGKAADRFGGHLAFWSLLEPAVEKWKTQSNPRSPLLFAEAVWFTVFALSSLSQFSLASGTAGSSPHLGAGWGLVVKALDFVKWRYDEVIENRMPNSAIRRRDRCIRTIILRCHHLSDKWRWALEDADTIIFKLFDIFNSHKLTDLPTDGDHDFPVFLRQFDAELLVQPASREPTAYLTFVNLLAKTAQSKQADARDLKDAERRVSRLCSRLCPVRVMPFTKENPPTAHERSSLFNHYTLVMLYLFLVPSAAAQRLRQMKGLLVFQSADVQSQITCIRAMLYTIAILGDRNGDIAPVLEWLATIVLDLLTELESVVPGEAGDGNHFATVRKVQRLTDLLVHSLRSIQHMIENPCLRARESLVESPYPAPKLLNPAWTSRILESRIAVDYPSVGKEALRCVQSFLLRRNFVMEEQEKHSNAAADAEAARVQSGIESQNSISEAFDDDGFDFMDPELEQLLSAQDAADQQSPGASSATTSQHRLRAQDHTFAETVGIGLSASLFQLLSNAYHPDRCSTMNRTASGQPKWRDEQTKLMELCTDCWAGCANILVQTGLRDWHGYLNYGNECWKRLGDVVGRQDIGLRFLQNVAMLDHSAYHDSQSEFLQVWFQSAAAYRLSVQGDFSLTLFRTLDPGMPWFKESMSAWPVDESKNTAFRSQRLNLIKGAVQVMRKDFEETSAGKSDRRNKVFPSLSGLLCSMRVQLDELQGTARKESPETRAEYMEFCRAVIECIRQHAGDTLMRGISREVERTGAQLGRLMVGADADASGNVDTLQ